jgi:Cu(I)-responsive transcriptional regulator
MLHPIAIFQETHMPTLMNIGQAATAAGVSPKMIRHYELIGLLPEPDRNESGYRLYSEREVSVLRFIGRSRHLGFSIPQIAELIGLWSDSQRSSREVKSVAERHLASLDEKRREIEQMMAGLSDLVHACQGNDHPHCAILDTLSQQKLEKHQPTHRPQLKKGGAKDSNSTEAGAGHIDLMAWMRGVHVHHGAH